MADTIGSQFKVACASAAVDTNVMFIVYHGRSDCQQAVNAVVKECLSTVQGILLDQCYPIGSHRVTTAQLGSADVDGQTAQGRAMS